MRSLFCSRIERPTRTPGPRSKAWRRGPYQSNVVEQHRHHGDGVRLVLSGLPGRHVLARHLRHDHLRLFAGHDGQGVRRRRQHAHALHDGRQGLARELVPVRPHVPVFREQRHLVAGADDGVPAPLEGLLDVSHQAPLVNNHSSYLQTFAWIISVQSHFHTSAAHRIAAKGDAQGTMTSPRFGSTTRALHLCAHLSRRDLSSAIFLVRWRSSSSPAHGGSPVFRPLHDLLTVFAFIDSPFPHSRRP